MGRYRTTYKVLTYKVEIIDVPFHTSPQRIIACRTMQQARDVASAVRAHCVGSYVFFKTDVVRRTKQQRVKDHEQ